MFKESDILQANKTSRNSKAIGGKAITPIKVRQYAELIGKANTMILDFGAGKAAAHTRAMLDDGFDCTAYEFGQNHNDNLHFENALRYEYDIVFSSNVLNVQADETMARETIRQCYAATAHGGTFFANYPISPRKSTLNPDDMAELLREKFCNVARVGGSAAAPLWQCSK